MRSPRAKRPKCHLCRGYGGVREVRRSVIGTTTHIATCPRCGGSKIEPRYGENHG